MQNKGERRIFQTNRKVIGNLLKKKGIAWTKQELLNALRAFKIKQLQGHFHQEILLDTKITADEEDCGKSDANG